MYYSERMVKTVVKYQFEYHKVYLEAHPELATMRRNGITTVPKGYVIHHKDLNRENNDLSNLELMTDKEHKELHGKLHRGSKGYQWIEVQDEMVKDILSGLRRKEFCEKYKVSKTIWEKAKALIPEDKKHLIKNTNLGRKASEETKKRQSKGHKNSEKVKAYVERKTRPIDPEMIEDVSKGMTQYQFKKKYDCFASVWYRAKTYL